MKVGAVKLKPGMELMTMNPRVALVCAACILFSGFLIGYKGFELEKSAVTQSEIAKSQSVAKGIELALQERIKNLEASVSYLDKSTVETLKRFGTRYFSYAFKKDGEWSIKWKLLGKASKEQILAEMDEIKFDKLSQESRTWIINKDKKQIFIAPVALAESIQLSSGFLVFGIDKDFFNFIKSDVAILSAEQNVLFGELPAQVRAAETFFTKDSEETQLQEVVGDEGVTAYTNFFSPMGQAWIVSQAQPTQTSFVASSHFLYFLLGSLLGILFFFALAGRLMQPTRRRETAAPSETTETSAAAPVTRTEPVVVTEEPVEEIDNFANLVDTIVADEVDRLQKVGVSIKTQIEEGAHVLCSPQRVTDLLKRLIGNSVLTLADEDEKEIQIQLVEQQESYQLIYVDTRTKNFPSGTEPSLLLQTEGSMEGIDGIIAYASWLFGEGLEVARRGFCLSVDLPKAQIHTSQTQPVAVETIPIEQTLERIEITDADTDPHFVGEFAPMNMDIEKDSDEPTANFEDVIGEFRMKSFEFSEAGQKGDETSSEEKTKEEVPTDDKGLFEIESGNFKLKIRSPKKRDMDVDSGNL